MLALILADGAFPTSENRLDMLRHMEHVVCCDGAITKLVAFGREPMAIVGDMDSIPNDLKVRFSSILHPSSDQETNDLTKAVEFCIQNGFDELAILGATGLREDHALGNISLLAEYAPKLKTVCMLTDYGRIDTVQTGSDVEEYQEPGADTKAPIVCTTRGGDFTVARFESFNGQQVSIFSLQPETKINSLGLKYPLENRSLRSWWQGTLNECNGEQFSLSIDKGCLLVYRLDSNIK